MGANSNIEWCDHTFNPWMGCTKVSEGCRNCYAENQMDHRWGKVQWGPGKPRVRTSEANWRKPLQWNAKAEKDGTRPRVFCASLADWLDSEVPGQWLADLMGLIELTPHLDWLLLTKRPQLWRMTMARMHGWLERRDSFHIGSGLSLVGQWCAGVKPPNVWLGTTVENQEAVARRVPLLLEIPARVRFLSCEPLLGPVDIYNGDPDPRLGYYERGVSGLGHWWNPGDGIDHPGHHGVDWVICGGESGQGPNIRPMHPDWARSLRDQCAQAEVPFFFKQWGEWRPPRDGEQFNTMRGRTGNPPAFLVSRDGTVHGSHEAAGEGAEPMIRVGKKAAGRLLDGVEHNSFPGVAHA